MTREEEADATPNEAPPKVLGHVETREPEFPQLTKLKAFDRQHHVAKALEMGASREEAERHADEDVGERDDSRP